MWDRLYISMDILLSHHVFSKVKSRKLQIRKNKNFEYAHQILNGNHIKPPISENHNRMHIITLFAYHKYIIITLDCNIMHEVHPYLTKDLNSSWTSR